MIPETIARIYWVAKAFRVGRASSVVSRVRMCVCVCIRSRINP